MTREEAKSEIMQIYGMLSPQKQMAINVLMAGEIYDNISDDGTMFINVEGGRKVSRIFVSSEDGWNTLFYTDGLYYPSISTRRK